MGIHSKRVGDKRKFINVKIVNYEIGQQIREHDGMFDLWEVL